MGSLPEVACKLALEEGENWGRRMREEGRRDRVNKEQAVWKEFHQSPYLECIRRG